MLDAGGETLDAQRLGDECRALIARLDPTPTTVSGLVNLALLGVDEDPERALRELVGAAGPELERLDPVWGSYPMFVAARAAVAAGRVDEAAAWADRLERHPAVQAGLTGARVRALGAQAVVALARGEAEAAAGLALDARNAAAQADLRQEEFDIALVAGRALADAGRRDDAAEVLQGAAALAAGGGARKLVDAAGRELRRIGSRLAAGTARTGSAGGGLDGLTDREREIAALVAEGKSNKQVAAAVFLSEKTVEHHLSRIFAKVGVRSRVELTRVIAGG